MHNSSLEPPPPAPRNAIRRVSWHNSGAGLIVTAIGVLLAAGCASPGNPLRATDRDPACQPVAMQGNGGGIARCPQQPAHCACQEM